MWLGLGDVIPSTWKLLPRRVHTWLKTSPLGSFLDCLTRTCMLHFPMEQRLGELTHLHVLLSQGSLTNYNPPLPLHPDGAMWLFISHQLTVNGSDVCITMWPGKERLCLHCYPFPWVNGENSMDLKKIRATQWKEPGSWMATWSRATSPSHLGLLHEQEIISDSVLSHSNVGVVSIGLACNKFLSFGCLRRTVPNR